jgi:hypothetical protein
MGRRQSRTLRGILLLVTTGVETMRAASLLAVSMAVRISSPRASEAANVPTKASPALPPQGPPRRAKTS